MGRRKRLTFGDASPCEVEHAHGRRLQYRRDEATVDLCVRALYTPTSACYSTVPMFPAPSAEDAVGEDAHAPCI